MIGDVLNRVGRIEIALLHSIAAMVGFIPNSKKSLRFFETSIEHPITTCLLGYAVILQPNASVYRE